MIQQTFRIAMCLGLLGWAPVGLWAANVSDAGNLLTIELGAGEQVTIVTFLTRYGLTSNATFVDSGVADPATDFTGFGTTSLTIESGGLARYANLAFRDAAGGASLSFDASGITDYSDGFEVRFDGAGSQVTVAATVRGSLFDFEAEAIAVNAPVHATTLQRYGGPVTLGGNLELSGDSGVIQFESTVDGAQGLTLNTSGLKIFNGQVGGSVPLTGLTIDSRGGMTFLAAGVTTNGSQSYGDPVSPIGPATVLRATEIDFDAGPNSVSGSNSLILGPFDAAADFTIGQTSDTGAALDLTDADLAALANGFLNLTVTGGAASSATITGSTFRDDLAIVAGDIEVNNLDVGSNQVILQALTGGISTPAGSGGTVGGNVTVGGQLTPGSSPGIFTVQGDLTLDASGGVTIEIGGTAPGSEHDQIRIFGSGRTLDLNDSTLTVVDLGHVWIPGEEIVIVDVLDAGSNRTGTFAGLTEDDPVALAGRNYRITYFGGDGNDVSLLAPTEVAAFEHDSAGGRFNALLPVADDTYVLAYAGESEDAYIKTLTIPANGSPITEVHSIEHDGLLGRHNALVQVDADTFALAYTSGSLLGFVKTFTIPADGSTITEVQDFLHETNRGIFHSMVQVDADTYLLAYTGKDERRGIIKTLTISADGSSITQVQELEHDSSGRDSSLVQVDADTYALAYQGTSDHGILKTFTVSADGSSLTEVQSLTYDMGGAQYNSLIQVDADTYLLAYSGADEDGFVKTFTISADGATLTEVDALEHDPEQGFFNSLARVDADTFALAYRGVANGFNAFLKTFTVPADGSGITQVRSLVHDPLFASGQYNSLIQVDVETYALAYSRNAGEGILKTFQIFPGGSLPVSLMSFSVD